MLWTMILKFVRQTWSSFTWHPFSRWFSQLVAFSPHTSSSLQPLRSWKESQGASCWAPRRGTSAQSCCARKRFKTLVILPCMMRKWGLLTFSWTEQKKSLTRLAWEIVVYERHASTTNKRPAHWPRWSSTCSCPRWRPAWWWSPRRTARSPEGTWSSQLITFQFRSIILNWRRVQFHEKSYAIMLTVSCLCCQKWWTQRLSWRPPAHSCRLKPGENYLDLFMNGLPNLQ